MFAKGVLGRMGMSLLIAGIALSLVMVLASLGGAGAERADLAHTRDNLLRLHVVGHSDLPKDQQAKLEVRDALLREMASWRVPTDRTQLETWFEDRREHLILVAQDALRRSGTVHPVDIRIGRFAFPPKRSGEIVLPAGEYRAVKVVIGDGAGHNWWCVLFPPLCFVEEEGGRVEVGPGVAPGERLAEGAESLGDAETARMIGEAGGEAGSAGPSNSGHTGQDDRGVVLRLRLWESLSESAYAQRLQDLLNVSLRMARDLTL